MAQLAASAQRMLRHAMLLSWEAAASLSEVLITADGLAGSAADVMGTLVPWRRGRIQTFGMPLIDRVISRSACWNVGNPKGCQSPVGNLDGCPWGVISTGGLGESARLERCGRSAGPTFRLALAWDRGFQRDGELARLA